jgi:hypothetical protein
MNRLTPLNTSDAAVLLAEVVPLNRVTSVALVLCIDFGSTVVVYSKVDDNGTVPF